MTGRKIVVIIGENDRITKILIDKYNYIQINYDDLYKDACRQFFNLTYDQIHGNEYDAVDQFWTVTPKEIIMFVQTKIFENELFGFIPNIESKLWIKYMERKFNENPNTNYVVNIQLEDFSEIIGMLYKYDSII